MYAYSVSDIKCTKQTWRNAAVSFIIYRGFGGGSPQEDDHTQGFPGVFGKHSLQIHFFSVESKGLISLNLTVSKFAIFAGRQNGVNMWVEKDQIKWKRLRN